MTDIAMTDIAMTDLEITLLCAEAMGGIFVFVYSNRGVAGFPPENIPMLPQEKNGKHYDPLHDDAQAMALVKKLHLHIDYRPGRQLSVQPPYFEFLVTRTDNDLNRAICECAAKVQLAKVPA